MKRGQYDKTTTETQNAKIARYAAENGIAAVLRHLKTKQGLELKESTVKGRKKTYCADLASRKRKGDDKPVVFPMMSSKHGDSVGYLVLLRPQLNIVVPGQTST